MDEYKTTGAGIKESRISFYLEESNTKKNQCEKTRFYAALSILPDILLLIGLSRIIVESLIISEHFKLDLLLQKCKINIKEIY